MLTVNDYSLPLGFKGSTVESQKYLQHVEEIIESKSFGRSDTYANLLRYLVRCTIEKDVPKETTIASEIFGKSSFDPSQSTLIRVYVYNLRKKLRTYYANEGVGDPLVLKIPKGGYEVSFESPQEVTSEEKRAAKKWILPLILAITASLVGFFVYSQWGEDNLKEENSLWSDLFESKKTTMLVLGDLFTYTEIDSASGLIRNIRDPLVNSPQAFRNFQANDQRTGITLETISYTYQIRSSTLWVKDLGKIFYDEGDDFIIRSMSRFNPKELPDNDFIVIGMLKTLGIFIDYLEKYGCTFEAPTDLLTCIQKNNVSSATYSPSGDPDTYHTDYAVMAKVPGPNNNVIYIFGGILDTGTSQSLKNFTDTKLLQELERRMRDDFGEIPKYYKILFEVSGVDRTELNSKILSIEKIETGATVPNFD